MPKVGEGPAARRYRQMLEDERKAKAKAAKPAARPAPRPKAKSWIERMSESATIGGKARRRAIDDAVEGKPQPRKKK